MKKINKVIIRINAGNFYGLGHLSRCISILNELKANGYLFIIKTDNEDIVLDYLQCNFEQDYELIIISEKISVENEIQLIAEKYNSKDVLIIDHYDADEEYQKQLFDRQIEWLQLDSHAKYKFYATWVMHGSPGATEELYEPLRLNPETNFLLGSEYCIIKKQVLSIGESREQRESLKKVLICFGGGDDRGATLSSLQSIQFDDYQSIEFYVSISPFNPTFEQVAEFEKQKKIQIIQQDLLHVKMKEVDLAIVAPGMISYESAYLGLPMLLVTIADNQIINSKAWEKSGCAINIGPVDNIKNHLNNNLQTLINTPGKLQQMSVNCLKSVDGDGVKRIVKQLTIN